MAIVYVLQTARESQIIIIDEPQNFLHPGAARKLIELLHDYGKKHQIIIATHSPVAIFAAEPKTMTLIKQNGSESDFEKIDIQQFEHQRACLAEVGVRPSDVFGYDHILWVEGETEEKCFPMILQKNPGLLKNGTMVLKVQNTGDFEGKNADKVIAIYKRLSEAQGGLFPDAVSYIFDRETRSEEKIADLKRLAPNRIHFIPRRLYENYLLNPEAISAVINEIKGFSKEKTTVEQINEWFGNHKQEPKYYKPFKPSTDHPWTADIDGAKFLIALFSELSDNRVPFDKTEHSPALTNWIIENSIEDLSEISNLLADILQAGNIS